jgi:hypothetical protein
LHQLCNSIPASTCQDGWQVETDSRVTTAWSVCTAVGTVLCKDGQQMHAAGDSGGDENVKFI